MVFTVLLTVAAFYVGLTLILYAAQGKLIFPAGGVVNRSPEEVGWPFEEFTLEVDGESTHGWLIPVEEARGVVLISHGNAGTIADRLETAGIFRDLGFTVCLYDYGGYGRSSGKPSEERCYADIRGVWGYLTETSGVDPERIVLFGRSLGGGPTCQLACEVGAKAVILESTFISAAQLGQESFPFVPVKLLIRHRFDNLSKVEKIEPPLLVVHSPDDDVIPFGHGRALFEAAKEPKRFLKIRGFHNDGFYVSGDTYVRGLEEFLDPLFP